MHELYVSFFRVYKRSIRVLSARCIVSFVACRCTVKRGARHVDVVSPHLSCYIYIYMYVVHRSRFCKTISRNFNVRRFARTLTFVRKFYQFDNIARGRRECVLEKGDDTREGGFYMENVVENQGPRTGDIDF